MTFVDKLKAITEAQDIIINNLTQDIRKVLTESLFTNYILKMVKCRSINPQSDYFSVFFSMEKEDGQVTDDCFIVYYLGLRITNHLSSVSRKSELNWSILVSDITRQAMLDIIKNIIVDIISQFEGINKLSIEYFEIDPNKFIPAYKITFKNPLK